jgi:hypothetical protein
MNQLPVTSYQFPAGNRQPATGNPRATGNAIGDR